VARLNDQTVVLYRDRALSFYNSALFAVFACAPRIEAGLLS